ncbi:MAG: hypothetical protein M3259_06865 [Actinomycetota bacterium]|nr:hypothetical protein [Actinomycetota bacterium]
MICSERLTPLPLEPDDATPLREIRATPAVSRWWGPPKSELPDDEPEARCFAMLDGEKLARMIHYGEENTPEYRHATIHLFGDPARRGRGPETIEALVATSPGSAGITASGSTPRWPTRRRSSPTRRPVFAESE